MCAVDFRVSHSTCNFGPCSLFQVCIPVPALSKSYRFAVLELARIFTFMNHLTNFWLIAFASDFSVNLKVICIMTKQNCKIFKRLHETFCIDDFTKL